MFILRSGMGIIQSLKAKFAGRKQSKAKLTFRAWCKANGHEVGQGSVGQLMQEFIAQVKPSKAGVRAAVAGEFAQAVKASVPPSMDAGALDAVTRSSAKAGSIEAVALRASLDLESQLPEGIEAQIDRVNALLDSGRQAEGLRLLKVTLAQLQPTLPAAKDAGSPLSASSKTVQPTHSKKAEQAVDGAKLSAPPAKAKQAATPAKTQAAGAIQLSDRPTNTTEAVRKERVKRLLADCGVPLDSTEGVTWCELGEKNLRSLALLFKRKLDATRTWKERQPLEDEVLAVLAGNGQPVDVFRKYKFLSDDDANTRTILR